MGLHLAPPTQNATAKYYHLPYSPLAVICLNCSSFFSFIYLFFLKKRHTKAKRPTQIRKSNYLLNTSNFSQIAWTVKPICQQLTVDTNITLMAGLWLLNNSDIPAHEGFLMETCFSLHVCLEEEVIN